MFHDSPKATKLVTVSPSSPSLSQPDPKAGFMCNHKTFKGKIIYYEVLF